MCLRDNNFKVQTKTPKKLYEWVILHGKTSRYQNI